MRNSLKTYLIPVLLLLASLQVRGQGLAGLKPSRDILSGEFPNGVAYYLRPSVENSGTTDIAIVLKEAADTSLCQYLAKSSTFYKNYYEPSGRRGAEVFRYNGLRDISEADSLLCESLTALKDFSSGVAVLAAGRLANEALRDSIAKFATLLPEQKEESVTFSSQTSGGLRVRMVKTDEAVACVSATYTAGRTPRGDMDSILPELMSRYAGQLRDIFRSRAENAFRQSGIFLAESDLEYIGSASTSFDEHFIFSVYVAPDDVLKAASLLASVLSDIDSKSVSLLPKAVERSTPHSDAAVIDRFVSAYLFNADLASDADVNEYFALRPMSGARERELFHDFASSLLSPTENVVLGVRGPSGLDRETLKEAFAEGWESGVGASYAIAPGDTLKLQLPKSKLKLRLVSPEPATGGELWMFANGMRVIYKKTATRGKFSYAFLLRGGYSEIEGLKPGQGEFVQDMASLWHIGGMSPDSFRSMLEMNGISMDTRVSSSDMVISGSAPSSRLLLLMKTIYTMASGRKIQVSDYDWYRGSAKLGYELSRMRREGMTAALDSIVCSGQLHPTGVAAASLDEDFIKQTLKYYDDRFAGFNDGIIVLTGDLKADNVKKILTKYLGAFKVTNTYASRPAGSCRMQSGTTTYTAEAGELALGGGQEGVDVVISSLLPYSQERNYAFFIARDILRTNLEAALAGKGMKLEYSAGLETDPVERLSVKISCHPARADGVAPLCPPADPLTVLNIVRDVLGKLPSSVPDEETMKYYREWLTRSLDREMADDASLNEAILLRYTAGKDVIGGYKDKVKKLDPAYVEGLLSAISMAGRVEYVIF